VNYLIQDLPKESRKQLMLKPQLKIKPKLLNPPLESKLLKKKKKSHYSKRCKYALRPQKNRTVKATSGPLLSWRVFFFSSKGRNGNSR